jgi:transposase
MFIDQTSVQTSVQTSDPASVFTDQDIMLTVDYHDQNCVVRRRETVAGKGSVTRLPTDAAALGALMRGAARRAADRGGRAIWIQESTTGWARMQRLATECGVEFILANVLQMPLPPKARRRKTDKIDTARLEREYLNGQLPRAHQPSDDWRQLRRIVALRQNLVRRRTALTNWIDRYLAHETWVERGRFGSKRRERMLRGLRLSKLDRRVLDWKLDELQSLQAQLAQVDELLTELSAASPDARRLDAIRGLGPIGALAVVARIGPIDRFETPEQLIAFAGLAPGVQQSDGTRRDGKIGGGGTDKCLRHYLIEASMWARAIPRYRDAYNRAVRRRGNKIGRLVVARLLLRSVYKMLKHGLAFDPQSPVRQGRGASINAPTQEACPQIA